MTANRLYRRPPEKPLMTDMMTDMLILLDAVALVAVVALMGWTLA